MAGRTATAPQTPWVGAVADARKRPSTWFVLVAAIDNAGSDLIVGLRSVLRIGRGAWSREQSFCYRRRR